jgi:hypothetical protein
VNYLAVSQTFRVEQRSVRVTGDRPPQAALTGLGGDDFKECFVVSAAPFDFGTAPQQGLSAVCEAVPQLLSEAAQARQAGTRLVRQQLGLWRARVYDFHYDAFGKSYKVWFWGRGRATMYAPVNPVTDAMEETIAEALEQWETRPTRAAAQQLQDGLLMAKADRFCAEALARWEPRIPDDLSAKAKTVWSELKLILVTAGSAVLGMGAVLLNVGNATEAKPVAVTGGVLLFVGVMTLIVGLFQRR